MKDIELEGIASIRKNPELLKNKGGAEYIPIRFPS